MTSYRKLKKTGTIHDTITGYDFRIDRPLTRSRAIRQKCLECCCNFAPGVRNCHIYDCTLWPWRMGRVPKNAPTEPAKRPGGAIGEQSAPGKGQVPPHE